MPRRPRVEVEGGVYHVYNRAASGEPLFAEPQVALDFVQRIRTIKERSGWTVFAWCLMTNHYHLAVRRSTLDLGISLHALQGEFSRGFNRRHQRSGSQWHSRYQAKLIDHQRYLSQLILYIHLNPVRARLVDDPALYPFSGHREIARDAVLPLVDVDDALLCFDEERAAAREAYVASIEAGADASHDGGRNRGALGSREWWLYLPQSDVTLAAGSPRPPRHGIDQQRPPAADLLGAACEVLAVQECDLNGRGRTRRLATVRRLVAAVLLDRWGVPRGELAAALGRNPEVISHWVAEARTHRGTDASYERSLTELDAALLERFSSS